MVGDKSYKGENMLLEGDIVIGKYANGECYLVKVMRFLPERKCVVVEYCNKQKSTGLFFLHEVVELKEELLPKIPESLRLIAQSFLEKKKIEQRV